MANDWIDEPKGSNWLDITKKSEETPLMKTLDQIGDNRQKISENPAPEPAIAPVEPVENVPYDKVIPSLESASGDVLAAFSRLGRASVNLSKISIIVTQEGPKGKSLLDKSSMYKSQVDDICMKLDKLSHEIAEYKNSLPKEGVVKI